MKLSEVPFFFDNHTHTLNPSADPGTGVELAANFLHGYRDQRPAETDGHKGMSNEQGVHLANMGATKTMVKQLADLYQCDPDLEVVTAERNRRIAGGIGKYTRMLYDDARIVGTVVDSPLPIGDETVGLFPCRIFRLFGMDEAFFRLLPEANSYANLQEQYHATIDSAIVKEGYAGLKCHVAEIFTLEVRAVGQKEAEASFDAAIGGDRSAVETVYYALFAEVLVQCAELDIPIHLHTGVTGQSAITGQTKISGDQRQGRLTDMDPFLLAPFLTDQRFHNTKIVLLHGGYPWLRNTAMMTHLYPHVWMDTSWTVPWASLENRRCFEEILAIAPHSKIMLGSGQHGIPEIGWLAAKISRESLESAFSGMIQSGLLAQSQALESAEMIMCGNAERLYKFSR